MSKFTTFTTIFLIFMMAVACACAYPLTQNDNNVENALDYIKTCQKDDGGFGESDRGSNPATSTWAIMAIVSAGQDPKDWKKNGTSAIDYLYSISDETYSIDGTTETAKMIMTITAAGYDPENFAGNNFITLLSGKKKENGQFGDHIYTTSWAVTALSANGIDASDSIKWLKSVQNEDGGFGWTKGAESDCDDTSSTLMALIAGGEPQDSESVQKAISFLKISQKENGGFNYGGSSEANSASDSWAIQAIVAAGENPESWTTKSGNNPVSHLLSLQADKGYFKWTDYLEDNKCRMSTNAIPALMGKPYPVMKNQKTDSLKNTVTSKTPDNSNQKETLKPENTVKSDSSSADSANQDIEYHVEITDDMGYTTEISKIPERIISLAPSNTEILYAIGAGDRVVGVTDYCNYPKEAQSKEKAGGFSSVNIEKVVSLKPDLVVAAYGNTEDVVNHLKDLGMSVITLNPTDLDSVLSDITLLGKATGNVKEAGELVSSLSKRIENVKSIAEQDECTPEVAHIVWYDPIWISGKNTFQDELIKTSNGNNAFGDMDSWVIVSMEDFITKNPDVLIVNSGSGMDQNSRDCIYEYIMNEPRFKNIKAVKEGRVYIADSDTIDRGGPRIVDALEEVAADIHPEMFENTNTKTETINSQTTPVYPVVAIVSVILSVFMTGFIRRRKD
ncbi:ABC transporter substrate-binding protein [Methanoplanus sp. FWC-SCC4]|uniref:ABC transporter substrate-binding protein n=1 Tax=Methanochimaera problematica TaxID=2609417 RepID=A0AA97FCF0_9EURY|nr:helical backbone metal receptor [Methanoplanus sp. FWC-SCC4]WOF15488.1 ABC transporter substrate-binding protein [Methanoplanus sp. FWC-SCC4]